MHGNRNQIFIKLIFLGELFCPLPQSYSNLNVFIKSGCGFYHSVVFLTGLQTRGSYPKKLLWRFLYIFCISAFPKNFSRQHSPCVFFHQIFSWAALLLILLINPILGLECRSDIYWGVSEPPTRQAPPGVHTFWGVSATKTNLWSLHKGKFS